MISIRADVQTSPGNIVLRWEVVPDTGSLYLYRKAAQSASWASPLATLPAGDTSFTDINVVQDSAYEYQLIKDRLPQLVNINPSGYIFSAIERAPKHSRGTFLLLVDSTFTTSCSGEIARLMRDINADGWKILRKDFGRGTKDTAIKNYIKNQYAQDNRLNSVFILGHIAIPYSGDVWPDSHPDHKGAWPADVYYGELDGLWTDITVDDTLSVRPENDNIPGDGKWDQSDIPTDVELAVGRVDFYDMPFFTASEATMMKNYLNKNHNYKTGNLPVVRRALIDDNFTGLNQFFTQETLGDIGWRNFSVMLGKDSVRNLDLISTLNTQNYQWAYGCGYGTYTSCQGIGSTTTFANNDVNAIFVLLFGSYYGNWDTKNNFLRAPLCSNVPALATCWAGRPKWHLHHMAMGETIGFSTLATQNNRNVTVFKADRYNPAGFNAGQISIALMGDPGLRLDYVPMPSAVSPSRVNTTTNVTWSPSPDPGVIGYYVYSSNDSLGNYNLRSPLVTGNSFTDNGNADTFYRVRAAKKQSNPSGAYINLSLGSTAIVHPDSTTGINSIANQSPMVNVYPNPAENLLHIDMSNENNHPTDIIIKSVSGITVKRMTTTDSLNSIDIRDLPPGLYLINVANATHSRMFKIVKS